MESTVHLVLRLRGSPDDQDAQQEVVEEEVAEK